MDLIDKINNYYLESNNNYANILNNDNIMVSYNNDIIVIKINNKIIAEANYKLLGIYNTYNSVWYWGYNTYFNNTNIIKKNNKEKYINKILKDNNEKTSNLEMIYYILSNDNFYISLKNIEQVLKVGLYIYKGEYMLQLTNNKIFNNNDKLKKIEYILLYNLKIY